MKTIFLEDYDRSLVNFLSLVNFYLCMVKRNSTQTIINDTIINKKKQKDIIKETGLSKAWVSIVTTRIKNLKYLPRIEDNKVVCLLCGTEGGIHEKGNTLVIHHDHLTNMPIAILCQTCNTKVKNTIDFDGILNIDPIYGKYILKYKPAMITFDAKIVKKLRDLGINVTYFLRDCLKKELKYQIEHKKKLEEFIHKSEKKKRLEQELGLKNVEERDKE